MQKKKNFSFNNKKYHQRKLIIKNLLIYAKPSMFLLMILRYNLLKTLLEKILKVKFKNLLNFKNNNNNKKNKNRKKIKKNKKQRNKINKFKLIKKIIVRLVQNQIIIKHKNNKAQLIQKKEQKIHLN